MKNKKNSNIIPFRTKKLSGMERVAIGSCVFVSLVAIAILVYLSINAYAYADTANTITTQAEEPTVQATEQETEPTTDFSTEPTTSEKNSITTYPEIKTGAEAAIERMLELSQALAVTEFETETRPEEVYEVQENLSSWFLENESTDTVTLWKKSDEEGLMISLRNGENESLVTFLYGDEDIEEDWTCIYTTTTQEIIDIAFVAYREVSGDNSEDVQAQIGVLQNRVESENFQNSIREVITARKQYSCKKEVLNRKLKSSNNLEREDLEKCFREVLKVLANEGTLEVPENVVYAATFKQGSGVWKVIDGTYYCYE